MHRSVFGALLLVFAAQTHAATVTYINEAAFQSDLAGGFTVIDTSITGPNIGKTTSDLSSQTSGAEFFGLASFVRSDGLIQNGAGFGGLIGLNFDPGVTAVGATSSSGDGGTIQLYDGLNGTGNLIGQVQFGTGNGWPSPFGGITSTEEIRSAIFTCDFDGDLKCGVIDPTFGAVVPIPAAVWLFGSALGLLGWARRRV